MRLLRKKARRQREKTNVFGTGILTGLLVGPMVQYHIINIYFIILYIIKFFYFFIFFISK